MKTFVRGGGWALLVGGALHIAINAVISPVYIAVAMEGEMALRLSSISVVRFAVALVEALLLIFGCIRLRIVSRNVGVLASAGFYSAFVGTCLVFASEWSNLFVLRVVAEACPSSLEILDKSVLLNAGFASAAGLFLIGWFIFTLSLWRSQSVGKWSPKIATAGLILMPILGASTLGMYGQIVANIIFGGGLIGLGVSLLRAEAIGEMKAPQ
jgi:hypothetical protein